MIQKWLMHKKNEKQNQNLPGCPITEAEVRISGSTRNEEQLVVIKRRYSSYRKLLL